MRSDTDGVSGSDSGAESGAGSEFGAGSETGAGSGAGAASASASGAGSASASASETGSGSEAGAPPPETETEAGSGEAETGLDSGALVSPAEIEEAARAQVDLADPDVRALRRRDRGFVIRVVLRASVAILLGIWVALQITSTDVGACAAQGFGALTDE